VKEWTSAGHNRVTTEGRASLGGPRVFPLLVAVGQVRSCVPKFSFLYFYILYTVYIDMILKLFCKQL